MSNTRLRPSQLEVGRHCLVVVGRLYPIIEVVKVMGPFITIGYISETLATGYLRALAFRRLPVCARAVVEAELSPVPADGAP